MLSGSADTLAGKLQYAIDSSKSRRISSLRQIVTLPANISKADKRPYAISLLETAGFANNGQDPDVPPYTVDPQTGNIYIQGIDGNSVDYIDDLMKKHTPGIN